ncbi:MAG: FixH family protein [Steroidobacteraceae bacterium]
MNTTASNWRANPALWLVIALPATAVIASFVSLYFSVHGGDAPLPDGYHWEGQALASDERSLQQAATLAISAWLRYDANAHECQLAVSNTTAPTLQLTLTHPTAAALDQHVLMQRSGTLYRGPCAAPASAHWWIQLRDERAGWMLRARTDGDLGIPLMLGARRSPS